jgi:hypothetical protein
MESFWVIVPKGEADRFLTLAGAYMRRRNYTVIFDRRSGSDRRRRYRGDEDRRLKRAPLLEPFEIVPRSASDPEAGR